MAVIEHQQIQLCQIDNNQLSKKYDLSFFNFFSKPREISPAQTSVIIIWTRLIDVVWARKAYTIHFEVTKGSLVQRKRYM